MPDLSLVCIKATEGGGMGGSLGQRLRDCEAHVAANKLA